MSPAFERLTLCTRCRRDTSSKYRRNGKGQHNGECSKVGIGVPDVQTSHRLPRPLRGLPSASHPADVAREVMLLIPLTHATETRTIERAKT